MKAKDSTTKKKKIQCNKPPSPFATNHWFEAKPGSWLQLENKRKKTADFGVIICFNDRSRLTVLDWIVKEAQHFFFKRKDNQIELSLKLSDNLTL